MAQEQRVSDEDLEYLHGILRRLDGETEIQIGMTHWKTGDIFWIVEEVMQARVWASDLRKNVRRKLRNRFQPQYP